ncbi:MAG: HD domain-containing protein [Acidobacteria bacterium]|nr:HD domain-containing protein [Acidobacteriota bacterium]
MSMTQPGGNSEHPHGLPIKAALEAARDELRKDTAEGAGGRAAVERHAARVDALLHQLFVDAGGPSQPVAIIALGGYGRRHLSLHSDIDLLLLFGWRIGPAEERFLHAFLNPIWDLGVVVGHQVREIEEFADLEIDNPEFLLALLDARLVAGAGSLFDRLGTAFHRASTHAYILRSLLQLVEERHATFNGTLYQLEPDVKEAPGALRDVMAARTIAALSDPLLLTRGPSDIGRLEEAEEFLLRVRSVLHWEYGRNQNVLSHELQERTADVLGYPGVEPRQRVERLMSDYFRHARTVSRSLEWARRAAPIPVGENLGLTRDGIRFLDPVKAAKAPESWVSAFQAAIDADTEVTDEALSCIRQHVAGRTPDDLLPEPRHRTALLRLFRPRPGLYARLSEMHDCGLLDSLFPEFQAISWRVVRDFYHKYTVDEHTLLAIRNFERLANTDEPNRLRFKRIADGLAAPELLALSLLLHDVGKWRDDEHALESERMAVAVLDRLELAAEPRETVLFLIRHHLRMSLAAFRRDTEDPQIVKEVANLVGSEERLKMLCLLTLADIEAVSPDTLTPWKEELIWRLYVDTYNHLTQRYADELIDRNQAGLVELLANRPADLPDWEITRFVEGLPQRYLQLFSRDAIYRHVRLARDIRPDEVHLSLERSDTVWTLAVVTLDKPFLFSNICGVLSSFGMNILRGHALTNPNGLVLDIFHFTDDERFLALNQDAHEQVLHELQEVVSGRSDVAELLRGREQSVVQWRGNPRVAPVVHTDNEASEHFTILDIVAGNALGLLYRISRVISRHGCDVDLVLISTEGERAIDVFHITKAGVKLTEAEQLGLTSDLQGTLEGTL